MQELLQNNKGQCRLYSGKPRARYPSLDSNQFDEADATPVHSTYTKKNLQSDRFPVSSNGTYDKDFLVMLELTDIQY